MLKWDLMGETPASAELHPKPELAAALHKPSKHWRNVRVGCFSVKCWDLVGLPPCLQSTWKTRKIRKTENKDIVWQFFFINYLEYTMVKHFGSLRLFGHWVPDSTAHFASPSLLSCSPALWSDCHCTLLFIYLWLEQVRRGETWLVLTLNTLKS